MRTLVALGQLLLMLLALALGLHAVTLLRGPAPSLLGALLLLVTILGFGGLVVWSERTAGSDGLRVGALIAWLVQQHPRARLSTLVLAAGVSCAALSVALAPQEALQPWGILAIWAVGCALAAIGAQWRFPDGADRVAAPVWSRWEVPLVTGITVVAFLARSMGNAQFPQTIHGDEAEMGLVAREVLDGTVRKPFVTGWLSHPNLWFFIQAAALRLLSDDISGLRTLSALFGAAAIPALYWFARPLYGRMISLSSALLLTALPLHLHFSRVVLNNIVDPTLALLACGTLVRAWRTGSRAAFALAGLLLGVAQYFYFGARVVPVVLLCLLGHQWLLARQRVQSHRDGVLLFGAGALVSSGPLIRHFLAEPGTFTARVDELGLFQSGRVARLLASGDTLIHILANQFWLSFLAYTSVPDRSLFYAADEPILSAAAALLFLCGLGVAIWRWREPAQCMLVVWICLTAFFGGVLIVDPPQIQRYLIATPIIVILVAQGGTQLAGVLVRACGITHGAVIPRATLMVSLVLMVQGMWFYTVDYLPRERYGGVRDLTAIARYLAPRGSREYTYFLGPPHAYFGHGTIRFVAGQSPGSDVLDPITRPGQVPAPPPGMRTSYIALNGRAHELRVVAARYPGGRAWIVPDPLFDGQILYAVYELP